MASRGASPPSQAAVLPPPLLPLLLLSLLLAGPATAAKGPPVRLMHVSPHLIARLGGSVRLNCPVEGTPQPMLEWRKDGIQVLPSWERFSLAGQTLLVSRVTADDAGVYVCVAVNGFGTERVTTELFVIDSKTSGFDVLSGDNLGPADNLLTSRSSPPVIQGSGAELDDRLVRAALGSRLQLSCVAKGYPQPDVKWYKAGRPVLPSTRLVVQDDGQLTITQLVHSDEGVFICVATNIFGSANHSFSLQITEPLSPDPVFLDAPNNATVYEGEVVVLQCRVQSVSKAHIKWVRPLVAGASPAFNQTQTVVIKGRRYAVIAGAAPTVQDGDQYFSRLTLSDVSASQQGVYLCMAVNANGYVGRQASVQLATVPTNSPQVMLMTLAAVAVVSCILGAMCCLHRRRRNALAPPGDNKTKQQVVAAPPGGVRPEVVSLRYPGDGDRALRTVLMPPARPSADGASVSCRHEVPPPAHYECRQFRHLDVV